MARAAMTEDEKPEAKRLKDLHDSNQALAIKPEWKDKPTVKTVHIHATSELIGMASTIRHVKCDIYEAADGTGRLLLVSKAKDKRRVVLSSGNYKMYELL